MSGGSRGGRISAGSKGTEAWMRRRTGLNLVAVLLATEYPIFARDEPTADEIASGVVNCLNYARKEVYTVAAHVTGLALARLEQTVCPQCDCATQMAEQARQQVLQVQGTSAKEIAQMVYCASRLTESFPAFLDRRTTLALLARFRMLKSAERVEVLQALVNMLPENEPSDPPLFEHLREHWSDLLSDTTEINVGAQGRAVWVPMVQLAAVRFLRHKYQHLRRRELEMVLACDNPTRSFATLICGSPNRQLRWEGYEFLATLYTHHPALRSTDTQPDAEGNVDMPDAPITDCATEEGRDPLRDAVRCALLHGLADRDDDGMAEIENANRLPPGSQGGGTKTLGAEGGGAPDEGSARPAVRHGVRRFLFDFWSTSGRLPSSPPDRLSALLSEFFDPSIAGAWVRYASWLLLQLSTTASAYDNKLFNKGLAPGSAYQPLQLGGAGGGASLVRPMAPLFSLERSAVSMASQDRGGLRGAFGTLTDDMSQRAAGFLRATQSFGWTQTQELHLQGQGLGLLMTQPNIEQVGPQGPGTAGGGLAPIDEEEDGGMIMLPGGEEGSSGQAAAGAGHARVLFHVGITDPAAAAASGGESGSSMAPPRAWVRGRTRFRQNIGFDAGTQHRRALAIESTREARKRRIVQYRRYRVGELPDIEIPLGDVLRPMQALCLHDSAIARQLFAVVLSRLFADADPELQDELGFKMQGMLAAAPGSTDFVGCLHAACLSCIQSASNARRAAAAALHQQTSASNRASQSQISQLSSPSQLSQSSRRGGSAGLSSEDVPGALGTNFPILALAVAESALQSLNLHSGILILEEHLLLQQEYKSQQLAGGGGSASGAVSQSQSQVSASFSQASGGRYKRGGRGSAVAGDAAAAAACEAATFDTDFDSTNQDTWLQLSRLYSALGEHDVLIGLSARAAKHDGTRKALQLELDGHHNKAIALYTDLVDKHVNPTDGSEPASAAEARVWDQRSLECMRQLGLWEDIEVAVNHLTTTDEAPDGDVDGLWCGDLREWALPHYVRSLLFQRDAHHQQILEQFIDTHARDPSKRRWMEESLSAELGLAAALRGHWGRARHHARQGSRRFLQVWSGLHPCALAARQEALRAVQRLVEIAELCDVVDSANRQRTAVEASPALGELVQRWRTQLPDPQHDPPVVWSQLVDARTQGLAVLTAGSFDSGGGGGGVLAGASQATHETNALTAPSTTDFTPMQLEVRSLMRAVRLEAASAAIAHGASKIARAHLHAATRLNPRDQRYELGQTCAVMAYNCLALSRDRKGAEGRLVITNKSLQHIQLHLDALPQAQAAAAAVSVRSERRQMQLMLGEWSDRHAEILAETDDTAARSGALATAFGALRDAGQDLLDPAAGPAGAGPVAEIRFADGGLGEEPALAFAKFCDKLLLHAEANDDTSAPLPFDAATTADQVACLVVEQTLLAMRRDALAANASVPRLLELLHKYPDCRHAFVQGTASVPTWLFLRWVSQMIAVLDRAEGAAVMPILERIAVDFPAAMRFPLKVSASGLSSAEATARAERLGVLLEDRQTDALVEALEGINPPELRLKDGLKAMQRALVSKMPDVAAARQAWIETRAQVMTTDREHVGTKIGKKNREFALYLKPRSRASGGSSRARGGSSKSGEKNGNLQKLDELFGASGELLTAANRKPLVAKISEISRENDELVHRLKPGKFPTEHRSEWLMEFDGSRERRDAALEVPGQYWWPERKPDPDRHARVSGFGSTLLALSSLRKPSRLTVHGDDEQEYQFLVKGGEDLRNDERVEQLLTLMNGILRADGACSAARLHCRTYRVVPMTTSLGIIEWVQHTKPLKAMFCEGLAADPAFVLKHAPPGHGRAARGSGVNPDTLFGVPCDIWRRGVFPKGTRDLTGDYHRVINRMKARDVVPRWLEAKQAVPWDLLRRRLSALAPSPEVLLTLRNEFARSLAVFSVCGYALGIGDRHTENFLIDLRSGALVPIDFGMAFGMGTSVLPVPELMPFRLTPQFSALLRPLDSVGLLAHHATLAMRALREKKDALLRTMDVFLNDPIVDWLTSATKRQPDDDAGDGGVSWEPARRIHNARRKLNGHNPMDLLLDDLAQNKMVARMKSMDDYRRIVRGDDPGGSLPKPRRLVEPDLQQAVLPVADQVACLIDIAKDPNVLGRQWQGLATWF